MGVRRSAAATALVGALALLSACEGAGGAGDEGDGTAAGTTSSTSPAPSDTASGPSGTPEPAAPEPAASESAAEETRVPPGEHAVEPPGPREGPLSYADILVNGTEEIDDETLERVRSLPGVTSAVRIALAQVSFDNRLANVAAVDPGTYRNFAAAPSADTQAVWDRVAAGEVAVDTRIRRRLPIDEDGYVRLGSDKDAPQAHVGAFADQVEDAVDLVVNEEWIPVLGMMPGNALLVSTTGVAPQSVEKELARAVGEQHPLHFVDAVARYGLRPGAQQSAVVVGASADAVGTFRYTVLGGGRIAPDPAWVRTHISTEAVPILGTITCNKLLFPQLRAALEEVVQRGLASKIHPDEYAGCYYPRFIAGSTTLSNHSFGTALDLNVPGNGRGSVGAIDRQVVAIFKKWGFAWGGDWKWTDPMHFEMNAVVDPR